MVELEKIQKLMEELGPSSDDIAGVAQSADNIWAVAFDDDSIVLLELDSEQGKLVLSTDLGKPEESRQLDVYSTLLNFNYIWRDTGGVVFAIADEEVTQIFPLTAIDLTLVQLRGVLGNFVEKAQVFKDYIAETGVPVPAIQDFEMMRI